MTVKQMHEVQCVKWVTPWTCVHVWRVPADRWDQGVQGNLWSLHLPSVQTYPADLWDQALHQPPERKDKYFVNFKCLTFDAAKSLWGKVLWLSIGLKILKNTTRLSSFHASPCLTFTWSITCISSMLFRTVVLTAGPGAPTGPWRPAGPGGPWTQTRKRLLPQHPIKALK